MWIYRTKVQHVVTNNKPSENDWNNKKCQLESNFPLVARKVQKTDRAWSVIEHRNKMFPFETHKKDIFLLSLSFSRLPPQNLVAFLSPTTEDFPFVPTKKKKIVKKKKNRGKQNWMTCSVLFCLCCCWLKFTQFLVVFRSCRAHEIAECGKQE